MNKNVLDVLVDMRVKEILGEESNNVELVNEFGVEIPSGFVVNEFTKNIANNYLKSYNKANEKMSSQSVIKAMSNVSMAVEAKAVALANCKRQFFGMAPNEVVELMGKYSNAKNANKLGISVDEYIARQQAKMAETIAKRNATIASKLNNETSENNTSENIGF